MITPLTNIITTFTNEFAPIIDKFNIVPLSIAEAYGSKDERVWKPGVYIFWHKESIIKVGRHLTNSRKRALEHIRDNTRNDMFEMSSLKTSTDPCGVVLINCKDLKDYHWAAAIEIYMEDNLSLKIQSKRKG